MKFKMIKGLIIVGFAISVFTSKGTALPISTEGSTGTAKHAELWSAAALTSCFTAFLDDDNGRYTAVFTKRAVAATFKRSSVIPPKMPEKFLSSFKYDGVTYKFTGAAEESQYRSLVLNDWNINVAGDTLINSSTDTISAWTLTATQLGEPSTVESSISTLASVPDNVHTLLLLAVSLTSLGLAKARFLVP